MSHGLVVNYPIFSTVSSTWVRGLQGDGVERGGGQNATQQSSAELIQF